MAVKERKRQIDTRKGVHQAKGDLREKRMIGFEL